MMTQGSPDPYLADTEEYISEHEVDTTLMDQDGQLSIGSEEDPRESNIFVTREELEDWETELEERVQGTQATLSQLLPMCEVFKSQVLKDVQTLRSLGTLWRPEEVDSGLDIIVETSEDEDRDTAISSELGYGQNPKGSLTSKIRWTSDDPYESPPMEEGAVETPR